MTQANEPSPTQRLRFRRYQLGDVESVIEMFDDDEARRWYPTTSQRAEATRWIEWNLRNYEDHSFGLWVVEDRTTGAFLGDCGLTYQTVETDRLLEIGYHLQARHRGIGYARESAQACADFARDVLGASSVCSIVDPRNESSIHVAEAIHDSMRTFTNAEGELRNLYWTNT